MKKASAGAVEGFRFPGELAMVIAIDPSSISPLGSHGRARVTLCCGAVG
jgi:hypothetical protein